MFAQRQPQPTLKRLEGLSDITLKLSKVSKEMESLSLVANVSSTESSSENISELTNRYLSIYDEVEQLIAESESETASLENLQEIKESMIHNLEDLGIECISESTRFTPELHEIVETMPCRTAKEDGVIVRTVRTGFRINEVVLRKAQVVVKRYQKPDGLVDVRI